MKMKANYSVSACRMHTIAETDGSGALSISVKKL